MIVRAIGAKTGTIALTITGLGRAASHNEPMVRVPRRLLADGESVVLVTRPHVRRLWLPALVLLAVSPATTFAATVVEQPFGRWAVAALGAVLVLRYAGRPFLRWLTTTYLLTDRRLVVRGGLFTRWGRDLPLSWILDVTSRRGVLGRISGSGTLLVETTGDGGRLVLPDVPKVVDVQRELVRLCGVERAGRRIEGD